VAAWLMGIPKNQRLGFFGLHVLPSRKGTQSLFSIAGSNGFVIVQAFAAETSQ